jgi:hypothetical protein
MRKRPQLGKGGQLPRYRYSASEVALTLPIRLISNAPSCRGSHDSLIVERPDIGARLPQASQETLARGLTAVHDRAKAESQRSRPGSRWRAIAARPERACRWIPSVGRGVRRFGSLIEVPIVPEGATCATSLRDQAHRRTRDRAVQVGASGRGGVEATKRRSCNGQLCTPNVPANSCLASA